MRRPRKSSPVGVLTKTFRILDLIQSSPSPLTLQDVSARAGINKSTALRLLAHLEAERYLSRDEKGAYALGARLLRFGNRVNTQATLRETARQSLWELWRATQETVNLAVLEGLEVVYIDCLESPHDFRLVTNIGMRAVYYRTALGKAIAAFLSRERQNLLLGSTVFHSFTPNTVGSADGLARQLEAIRQAGFAVDNEESVLGLRCVSAPVLDEKGRPAAAISVSGPTSRITCEKVPEFAEAVRKAAQGVSARIAAMRA